MEWCARRPVLLVRWLRDQGDLAGAVPVAGQMRHPLIELFRRADAEIL
jgi:hypothetical protein